MMLIPGKIFLVKGGGEGDGLTPDGLGTPSLTGEGRISSLGPRDGNPLRNDDHLRILRMVTSIVLSQIYMINLHD